MRNIFHGFREVLGAAEIAADDAVHDAGNTDDQKDNRHDRLHDRRLKAGNIAVGIAENRIFRHEGGKQADEQQYQNGRGDIKSLVFPRRNFPYAFFGQIEVGVDGTSPAAPRFRNLFRYPPAAADNGKGRAEGIKIIAQHVDFIRRVDDLGGHLRKALNDRVDRRRRIVGRKGAGNTGKGSGDAGQRMLPRSVEQVGRNGNDDHVAAVRGQMAEHTDEDDDRRQEKFRRNEQQLFQARADIPRPLGDPDAQGRDDDHAQRRERSKVADHFRHQRDQRLRCQHIGHADFFARRRVNVAEVDRRANCR